MAAVAEPQAVHVAVHVREGRAVVDGRSVWLTFRECEVLDVLVERSGSVALREVVQQRIWGRVIPGHQDRSLDVYVRRLRAKLAEAAPDVVFIHTHQGVGYRFDPVPTEEAGS